MVNWLAPIVITLSDAVALWELDPNTNHGSAYLEQNGGLNSLASLSQPPRASVVAMSSQPLHRWRDPSYFPSQVDAGTKNRSLDVVKLQVDMDKSGSDLLAAIAAAIASRTATAPLERVKVMLQTGAFSEPVHGLRAGEKPLRHGLMLVTQLLIKLDGVRLGFFRGNAHPFEVAAAAALAGIVSTTLTHPLEVLRTRLYLMHSRPDVHLNISTAKLRPAASIWDTANEIIVNEGGVRGLYRGLGLSLFGIVPYLSTSFVLYDTLKPQTRGFSWEGVAIAAVSAGVAQTATYPFDLVRRRIMVEGMLVREAPGVMRRRGGVRILSDILRLEGMSGAFRGLVPNLIKVAPATGVTLYIHDQWRNLGI
ncbi:hypothetical protein HDU98_012051 [Podochytrium sp. JEL0797]|nr:hypothetical protein HDU98_012051 [Podochytrium sp. JEL0797]